jgi:hypothetical protein
MGWRKEEYWGVKSILHTHTHTHTYIWRQHKETHQTLFGKGGRKKGEGTGI